MNVDTGVLEGLVAAVERLEATVAGLAARVEHATEAEAIIRRAHGYQSHATDLPASRPPRRGRGKLKLVP